MKLNEWIIIYLAVAAPFAATRLLQARSARPISTTFLALGLALLWPLAALRQFHRLWRLRPARPGKDEELTNEAGESFGGVFRAEESMRHSLAAVEEFMNTANTPGAPPAVEECKHHAFRLRQLLDQHCRLSFASRAMRSDSAPEPRAVELCRLAGRGGEDLQIAARCLHRQNAGKLARRLEGSAQEFIHALAECGEAARSAAMPLDRLVAAQLSAALVRLYGSAVELFSHLDDQSSALRAGRLLDAECARLRRLESDRTAARVDFMTDSPQHDSGPPPAVPAQPSLTTLARG
ncbi:MAG TPA: hypothetical protein VM870_00525 [Pyrinomonadaceae bacterium]|nr:hypothetical protein [Pyrinomonadaceae bacterium]